MFTINSTVRNIFTLFMVLALGGCAQIYQTGLVPIPAQPISGPVEIGPEWIEITPPKPLQVYASAFITIRGIDYDSKKMHLAVPDPPVYLKDGRVTQIDAVLFDDKGESYELSISALGNGIDFTRKPADIRKVGERFRWTPVAFPEDRRYTKLRLKSDIPVRCSQIELNQFVPH